MPRVMRASGPTGPRLPGRIESGAEAVQFVQCPVDATGSATARPGAIASSAARVGPCRATWRDLSRGTGTTTLARLPSSLPGGLGQENRWQAEPGGFIEGCCGLAIGGSISHPEQSVAGAHIEQQVRPALGLGHQAAWYVGRSAPGWPRHSVQLPPSGRRRTPGSVAPETTFAPHGVRSVASSADRPATPGWWSGCSARAHTWPGRSQRRRTDRISPQTVSWRRLQKPPQTIPPILDWGQARFGQSHFSVKR
jgi:hypothetical protein